MSRQRHRRRRLRGHGEIGPPLPDPLTSACQEASVAAMARALVSDPHDGLAAALGRLGRAVMGSNA
jgi:hypothetical protein